MEIDDNSILSREFISRPTKVTLLASLYRKPKEFSFNICKLSFLSFFSFFILFFPCIDSLMKMT